MPHPRLNDLAGVLSTGPFRAVKHPDFRRFLTGQGISLVGTWMQSIAQGWLVLELTRSAFAVGFTATLATLPILLFTLYGGVVADRVDKRKFIMLLQAVMMLEAAVMAVLTLTGLITVEWIWGLALLFGLATAFEVPARQAYIVELVPPEDLVSAAAVNSTTYNLARVIGPAIAGVVVAFAGAGAAFAVNAVSYLAVLVGLSRIQTPYLPKPVTVRPSVFSGIRFIGSRPVLAALSWLMVLLTVLSASFIPILAVYAREVMRVGAQGFGALTAAVGVGAVTGAVLIGGVGSRIARPRAAMIGACLLGTAVIGMALSRNVALSLFLLGCAGMAMAIQGIATATSLQLATPNDLRGRVMAVYSFVVLGLAPFGAFQAGYVAEHFGAAWSIGLSGTLGLLGTAYLSRRLWHGKEETC